VENTVHRFYTLPDEPIRYSIKSHDAWIEMMELALGMLDQGFSNCSDIRSRMVQGVYNSTYLEEENLSRILFITPSQKGVYSIDGSYDVGNDEIEFAQFWLYRSYYRLSDYLSRIEDKSNPLKLDCYDTGRLVELINHSLGCEITGGKLDYWYAPNSITTRYLLAMGKDEPQPLTWPTHFINYYPPGLGFDWIYDATSRLSKFNGIDGCTYPSNNTEQCYELPVYWFEDDYYERLLIGA
jgi:hypothetical protein